MDAGPHLEGEGAGIGGNRGGGLEGTKPPRSLKCRS